MAQALTMDAETLRKYRIWFLIYGVLLVVLGAISVAMPGMATLATELLVGSLLLVSGIVGIIAAFTTGRSLPGFWWNLVIAVLYALAGIALLWHPVAGALTLTLILAAYLIAGGLIKAVLSVNVRRDLPKAWGWMLFSGLVDIALAMLILSGWPGSALWVIGLLVGINLIFTGVALIVASIHSRDIVAGVPRAA